ncbi:hypothetical protein C8A00DRAFT_30828 [Chaetomidium leptoderma]|uniref:Uncharacterized protein n=1 Tax=Chaetomidium leptoderma TaxID=669021 RepID=A0AAN6VR85_9PEZI|nr:hypothetical protein C8A00DRAFT_30828 [Chaetomidium leptoderma]
MATHSGRNLFRLTGDLRRVKRVCVATRGGVAEREVVDRPWMRAVLEGVEELCVFESRLLGRGEVSGLAEADWGYWVRWAGADGRVRWVVRGDDQGDGGS